MAKNAAKTLKQKSFEQNLWDTADMLRGMVELSEYKHVVSKANDIPLYRLYQVPQKIGIQSMGADSPVPGVNRNTLYASKVVCPQSGVLSSYWKFLSVLVQRQRMIEGENISLIRLGDTLLSPLLSGELRIPDAERQVTELV